MVEITTPELIRKAKNILGLRAKNIVNSENSVFPTIDATPIGTFKVSADAKADANPTWTITVPPHKYWLLSGVLLHSDDLHDYYVYIYDASGNSYTYQGLAVAANTNTHLNLHTPIILTEGCRIQITFSTGVGVTWTGYAVMYTQRED